MSVRAIFTGMLSYLVTPFPHASSLGSVAKVECDDMAGENPESNHANVSHNEIFSLKQINVRHSTHVLTTGVGKCVVVRTQLDLVLSDKVEGRWYGRWDSCRLQHSNKTFMHHLYNSISRMCTLQLTSEKLRLGGAALFGRSGGAQISSPRLNEIPLFIPEGDVTCSLDMYREWLEGLIFLQWWYIV